MLGHEFDLLLERLDATTGANRRFFAFADTVAARSFRRHDESHGWMGLRFQHEPRAPYSEIILHVRMLDSENIHQQEALGIFGVNLVHGATYHSSDPRLLIKSLSDGLKPGRIEVDMIRFSGPAFPGIDNRIMNLELIVQGLTQAALFRPDGEVVQAAEAFYKKPLLVERGSFRPVTLVTNDMLDGALKIFENEDGMQDTNPEILMEITMQNLLSSGHLDLRDFLDRVDMLGALGRTVLISNYGEFYRLVNFLTRYTAGPIGLPMGIPGLADIFDEKYYTMLDGGILEALGRLFKMNVRLYVYPFQSPGGELVNCENFRVAPHLKHLYVHLRENGMIRTIKDFQPEYLKIHSPRVLELIQKSDASWESMVPAEVAKIIKQRGLFRAPIN